jgi:regulator of sigma E protease
VSFLIDYVGPFVLMLGVLVLVHEVGHFWMAKTFKVKVERFSIGFGPSILRRKIGETEYVLAWFLLGGYVKMLGENPEDELSEEEHKRSFNGQSPWRRIGIALGGPAMNLLMPIVLFAALLMAGWPTATSLIGSVPPDTPAARAGLRAGDRIVSIDGDEIWRWRALRVAIQTSDGKPLHFGIERAGELLELSVTPEAVVPGGPLRVGIEQARAAAVLGVFEQDGAAALAGLRTGDVVVSMNGAPVVDWYGFTHALEAAAGTLSLQIERPLGGETERVELQVASRSGGSWSLERLGAGQVETSIQRVEVMSPAKRAGLEQDDLVLAVNGVAVRAAEGINASLRQGGGEPLGLSVLRGGERLELQVTPEQRTREVDGTSDKVYAAGWYLGVPRIAGELRNDVVRNPLLALWRGADRTTAIFVGTLDGLGKLVTRKVGVENLAGPIGIGEIAGDSLKEGWFSFLTVMCVISVNLAILNLLPIPILDGGHIIFSVTELVQGGPVNARAREIAQTVGISLIVLLMGFAFWNDLSRQWEGILGFLSGLV